MKVFDDLDELVRAAPLDLGATGWAEITAADLNAFQASTGGPVTGYLAVSLTNRFLPDLLAVPAASSGVNYGAESIRLGDPLQAGDRVRATARMVAAEEVRGGVQTTVEIDVEVEGRQEPAGTVRSLSRWLS